MPGCSSTRAGCCVPIAVTDYEPDSNERIDSRTERALAQYLTVLADVGRAKGADDLFLVVSQSGTEYLVDTRTGAYECPDRGHRVVHCKPTRRVALATGEHPVPAGVDGAVPKPKYRRRDRDDAQLSTLGSLLLANARNRGATGQPVGPGLLVRVSK